MLKQLHIPGNRIPPRNQVVGLHERANLIKVADTEIYTHGIYSKEFEKRLAEFVGAKYCLLCNSGSSANLLALSALMAVELGERRLKHGDEVITTALNFPTTVNPIVQCGLVPVFVDIELPYYVPKYQTHHSVIINSHFLGNVCFMQSDFDNLQIDDCCDALGSRIKSVGDYHVGEICADISTFSFYPAHTITTGEGGAVCTDDPLLYKLMRSFRDWGRDCHCEPGQNNACGHRFDGEYDHKYTYSHIGYNLQMTEMQAALGVAQMDKLPGFIAHRKRLFKRYYDGLKDLEDIFILPEATPGSDPAWFGFPLTFRDRNAMDFCRTLEEKYHIHNRRMFAGNILRQPAYRNMYFDMNWWQRFLIKLKLRKPPYRVIGDLKNTNLVMDNGFWLWLSPSITDEMADYVIEVIHREVK